jgi:putative Ig domain-containing protein
MPIMSSAGRRAIVAVLWLLAGIAAAQQTPEASRLQLDAIELPKASPRHPYKFQFQARGGIPTMKYTVSEGVLPKGMTLSPEGLLSGTVPSVAQYRFTITVTDSSNPPQTAKQTFTLHGAPPMVMVWKSYAKVSGHRVDGSVVVSNNTEDDFDFTFIVLAVSENGRATAIGYQHAPLKSGVDSLEIPFGENLPRGTYEVHVDAVAEVADKELIYRSRLQTKDRLAVTIGP